MKNNYIIILPLLVLIGASLMFLTSEPVYNDQIDPAKCNCSGPKAFKGKSKLSDD